MQTIIKGIPAIAAALQAEAAKPVKNLQQFHPMYGKTLEEIEQILCKQAGPKGPKTQSKRRKLGRQNPNSIYA